MKGWRKGVKVKGIDYTNLPHNINAIFRSIHSHDFQKTTKFRSMVPGSEHGVRVFFSFFGINDGHFERRKFLEK